MQRRTETHIFISPPGAAPGAAHVWATPEVRVTWGCITKSVSPTRGITVKPQGGPSPPRARATEYITFSVISCPLGFVFQLIDDLVVMPVLGRLVIPVLERMLALIKKCRSSVPLV